MQKVGALSVFLWASELGLAAFLVVVCISKNKPKPKK